MQSSCLLCDIIKQPVLMKENPSVVSIYRRIKAQYYAYNNTVNILSRQLISHRYSVLVVFFVDLSVVKCLMSGNVAPWKLSHISQNRNAGC